MKNGHPTGRLMRAYAAGLTTEGVSLAIAAHLTYCVDCRARLLRLEEFAGALLSFQSEIVAPDMGELMDRLDEPEAPAPAHVAAGPLPRPVADMVGMNFDEIPWRFRLPGVHEYTVRGVEGEEVSLLRVRPGASIPRHTHEADELTVVFDGRLDDGDACYGVGDMAIADASVDHHPRAGGDRTCICLAVLTGGLRFTGPFGRALNLFS